MQDNLEIKQIKTDSYDYPLPDGRIAKYPLAERDKSKLLIYDKGSISETVFSSIPEHLPENFLMAFNNTRVIRARLLFKKETGTQIEIFCLEPENPADYALNFQSRNRCEWKCLIGNQKRWKNGVLTKQIKAGDREIFLSAELKRQDSASNTVCFAWDSPDFTFAEVLEAAGILPIPPYLHRNTEASDLQTYQTVYSKIKGSVAAPTAGLHFTPDVIKELKDRNFKIEELTLHVGAGTFKPVQSETVGNHDMHEEFFTVKRSAIIRLKESAEKIIAVGTTSARTLESLYYVGLMIAGGENPESGIFHVKQWQPYEKTGSDLSAEASLQAVIDYLEKNGLDELKAFTQIIIVPGYEFKLMKGLITNFHQPKSTLLLLVSAFVKGDWRKIYDYALGHDFRFLSYGDSSLLMM